jgi:acetyl-CoA acyltransferase
VPEAVIIDAVRSPMGKGKAGGALAGLHPVDLLAQVLQALVARTGIDPGDVDDVLVGCVSQAGEQSSTPGRQAWLAAGFPAHVPAATIDRKCGSSQQAVEFAAHGIVAGAYEIVIAAGVESMSRVPMGSARMGQDPFGPNVTARYPHLVPQGVSAELVAARWGLSRAELDEFALESHRKAAAATDGGAFAGQLIPVSAPDGELTADEGIRRDTSAAKLAALRPAFRDDGVIHAGNSSQISDGCAALLITTSDRAAELGLRPLARFHSGAVTGDDPVTMLTAPIPATAKVLRRAGLTIGDIGVFEVNEAFASVPLAWAAETGADRARLNPLGGAIAVGHPLGASGAILMTRMVHHMRASGIRYGLQTMCEAGGMANATVLELLTG